MPEIQESIPHVAARSRTRYIYLAAIEEKSLPGFRQVLFERPNGGCLNPTPTAFRLLDAIGVHPNRLLLGYGYGLALSLSPE